MKYSYNLGRLQGTVNTDKVTRWIPGGGELFVNCFVEDYVRKANDVFHVWFFLLKGKIQSRPCALQIGHGENFEDFEGDIDDVSKTTSFCCTFRTRPWTASISAILTS